MNVVYWRMVNGGLGTYMNGSTGLPTTGTTPGLSALAAPAAAPAPAGLTVPPTGFYPQHTYLSTPTAAATPSGPSTALTTPHSGLLPHKWVFPDWNMQQLQYMFLPKLPRLKGERVNKSVKCEICNITLNSEVQAKQHYSGKNHLKKMKQMGMALPGEEEGKKVMETYSNKSQDDSEAQSSTSETTVTDDITNATPDETTSTSQPNSRPTSPSSDKGSEEQSTDDTDSQTAHDSSLLGKLPRKRKLEIPCSVCDIVFNSEVQADQHFKGVRHAKRSKMAEEDGISEGRSDEDCWEEEEVRGQYEGQTEGQMEGHKEGAEVTWSAAEEGSNVQDEDESQEEAKERICDSIQSAFDMQPREGVCVETPDVCDS